MWITCGEFVRNSNSYTQNTGFTDLFYIEMIIRYFHHSLCTRRRRRNEFLKRNQRILRGFAAPGKKELSQSGVDALASAKPRAGVREGMARFFTAPVKPEAGKSLDDGETDLSRNGRSPWWGQAGSVGAEGHLTSVGWRWREARGQGDWAACSPERWLGESLISRTVSVEASPPFGIAQRVRAQERPLFSAVR